ncbi:MAG: hypothetical protein PHQ43_11655 [Dehalococcoidales bacterium]|nr:hypothetical protein [Dehalococcoidales bacterium]
MSWLDTLVSWFAIFSNTAATWEYNASTWSWPLSALYGFFVALSNVADGMFAGMLDFRTWLYQLANSLSEVYGWQNVINWLKAQIDSLAGVITWVANWSSNVANLVSTWWTSMSDTVKSWISTAIQGLPDMLTAWSNFITETLPTLFDLQYAESWWKSKLVDLGELISSAFVEREDLWNGWTDFRQRVSDFFSDPLEWIWSRFTDWFLGGE